MAAILFLSRRSVEGATLAASSAQTTLPVTNLIGPTPSKVWRSAGLSGVYITIDFGAATAVDTLAMVNPNWTTSATWRLRAAASEGDVTASPAYDSTAVTPWPGGTKPTDDWTQHAPLLRLGSTQTYRYWRIDLADAGNTAGYLEAGSLLLGASVGITYESWGGFSFDDEPNDVVMETGYGPTVVEERDSCRVFNIAPRVLAKVDVFGGLGAMLRERKASKPYLVCLDPAQTEYLHVVTLYGLTRGPRGTGHIVADLYGTGLKIKEHI